MNVIWFVLDTLRTDHLSCYDYFRETSRGNCHRIKSAPRLYRTALEINLV